MSPTPDEEFEPFAYTIGLAESYQHPEIMIFGLPKAPAHGILAECAGRISSGERFPLEEPVSEILAGDYQVVFRPVLQTHYAEFLGTAIRHYGHERFEAVVLFWPSKEGLYPWQLEEPGLQQEGLEITRQ